MKTTSYKQWAAINDIAKEQPEFKDFVKVWIDGTMRIDIKHSMLPRIDSKVFNLKSGMNIMPVDLDALKELIVQFNAANVMIKVHQTI